MSIVARFAPGVDPDRLPRTNGQFWKFTAARGSPPILPAEVSRLQQVDDLPLILGGLLALLATVAVGHAVVLGIRRRRRELAVLRTIGFERRDVRASIAYQSTILTVLGMLVGIPLGVVTGRLIWRAVADGLGVAARFDLSLPDVAVVAVGAVVVANAIGALAASASLRDRPAVTLAAE
jgi:ABC-type antimicrobial peptide transport system permease subunit